MHPTNLLFVAWWLSVHGTTAPQPDLDTPYCALRYRRLCQGKGRHVACQFSNPGPGETCRNYTQIEFTRELRHFVTHYINRRRQRVAAGNERVRGGARVPRPEVMMQVEWDRELAMLAQRLADQCNFVHDDCRATVRFPYAGQTVGEVKWRRSSESDRQNTARSIRRVLDAWWGERRRATVKQLIQPFRLIKGTVWGHFSQLAVWTLRAVGCGAARHGVRYPRILLVCDFSHTNMLRQRTLVPGPLAPCPVHTARRPRSLYPLLCAPVRHSPERKLTQADGHPGESYETDYDDDDAFDDQFDDEQPNTDTTYAEQKTIDVSTRYATDFADENTKVPYTPNGIQETGYPRTLSHDPLMRHQDNNVRQNDERGRKIMQSQNGPEEDLEQFKQRKMESMQNLRFTKSSQKPRYEMNMNYFITDATVRRFDDNYKFIRRSSTQPSLIRKLEHELDSDRDQASPIPSYDTRWKVTENSLLRYRTKVWTVLETESSKPNLLAFRTSEVPEFPDRTTQFYEPVRPRWRPTRDRPDRPGAKALLVHSVTATPTKPRAAKKASSMGMKIDKDDYEQLFLDTGFKPGHKKTENQ